MKRFVYVPVGMRDSEVSPVAEKLAAESRLSIRMGAVDDGIERRFFGQWPKPGTLQEIIPKLNPSLLPRLDRSVLLARTFKLFEDER